MTPRNTRTGGVLEQMVLPALDQQHLEEVLAVRGQGRSHNARIFLWRKLMQETRDGRQAESLPRCSGENGPGLERWYSLHARCTIGVQLRQVNHAG